MGRHLAGRTACPEITSIAASTAVSGGPWRILQGSSYVLFLYETQHEFRYVPLDGRPPPGKDIKLWLGSSRGHWEGNTLIIETTNHNDSTRFDVVGNFHSDEMRVTERFGVCGSGHARVHGDGRRSTGLHAAVDDCHHEPAHAAWDGALGIRWGRGFDRTVHGRVSSGPDSSRMWPHNSGRTTCHRGGQSPQFLSHVAGRAARGRCRRASFTGTRKEAERAPGRSSGRATEAT